MSQNFPKPLNTDYPLYNVMKQDMILISRKEYEGMKETIEVLQNPEIMKQILESEKNISKGKLKKLNI